MIPKTFQLLSYTWTVVMHDGPMVEGDQQCNGLCDFQNHVITLNKQLDAETLWHTWLHEVTHAVLDAIGRVKLGNDEGFVDSLSGALAQALRPASGKASVRPAAAAKGRRKPAR